MLKYFTVLLISSLVVFSGCTFDVCSSKRMYVNSYEQFMKKIEKRQDDFTTKQWEENDQKFERFSGECYDKFYDDLTSGEKKQINKYNFKYVVIRVKSELPFELSKENEEEVNNFIEDLELDSLSNQFEDFAEVWKNMDKTKFKEAADEFGKGFEKLEKAFEDLGKQIQEVFEETSEEKK